MGFDSTGDSSFIGYYYQGAYALVRLLNRDYEDAAISVETEDDVVLEDNKLTLHQLKHSQALKPKPLSIKDDRWWKTIRIWSQFADNSDVIFQFVTTVPIKSGCVLQQFLNDTPDYQIIVDELRTEANRVRSARKQDNNSSYKSRWQGCESFLNLGDVAQKNLIKRIKIEHKAFSVFEYKKVVKKLLILTPKKMKDSVSESIIEWWDRQIAMSLLKERERVITRIELIDKLNEISVSTSNDDLPDNFSGCLPPDNLLPPKGLLIDQIKLVDNGGKARIRKAIRERWRARSQRDKWQQDGFSVIDDLMQFDKKLYEEWEDRFEGLCEEANENKELSRKLGKKLLDWSHNEAPSQLPPIRKTWTQPFLVRGTYQQLANEGKIGWHPEFKIYLPILKLDL